MAIEIVTPTDEDWPAICRADGRAFGFGYSAEEIEQRRAAHDMTRFRIARERAAIVAIAGSYEMQVTLPGGAAVPMGGVTWVSTAVTHRRRGLMRQVVGAVHDDIDARGEAVASLYASQGGIYEHLGYGIGTQLRVIAVDPRQTQFAAHHRPPRDVVRYVDGAEAVSVLTEIWSRYWPTRTGEAAATKMDVQRRYDELDKSEGEQSPAAYLVHRDGFAAYRTTMRWNEGQPAHAVRILQLAAITPEAHVALWHALLGLDLVGSITSRFIAVDDPLPYFLEDQRALRTTEIIDGVWVNVRNIAGCFAARTYRTVDRVVVDADGVCWAIDGGPDGASVKRVRRAPDLVTSHAWLSSLLYGGAVPSRLVAGRRMSARNADVLARADLFFPTSIAPHCQTMY